MTTPFLHSQISSFLESIAHDDTQVGFRSPSSQQSTNSNSSSENNPDDIFIDITNKLQPTVPFVLPVLQMKHRRELGGYAQWILSSAKSSNGVLQLQDPDLTTFWQSDGKYPHAITLQFPKKYHIYEIVMYLDYDTDESYTPLEIDVLAGTNERDVEIINSSNIEKPVGYLYIPTLTDESTTGFTGKSTLNPIYVTFLQIIIKSSHQNGKDVHVRHLSILGAVPPVPEIGLPLGSNYSSKKFKNYAHFR